MPESSTESRESNTIFIDFRFKYSLKPAYRIAELRPDSPAASAGLMVGDVILTINGKGTQNMKLQDLVEMFSDDDQKLMRLEVERNDKLMRVNFKLENPLK